MTQPVACPSCGSERIRFRNHRGDWFCDDCDQRWVVGPDVGTQPLVFLSYARRDASDLATRLAADLERHGYRIWLDRPKIVAGSDWEVKIRDGLRSSQLVVAVLTPSAVRTTNNPVADAAGDSVCLDEISFARFAEPPTAIVPVMAEMCEPPFSIFRLDYVDMCRWRDSQEHYEGGLRRLLRGIADALAGKVAYRTDVTNLKPWDFAAFLYEKHRDFCGREWLLTEIELWLRTSREPALLVAGDPGVGKSALVAELVHRNPGGRVLAYHCCQADVRATLETAGFVRSIAAMIASQLPEYAAFLTELAVRSALDWDSCRADPVGSFDIGVVAPLQRLRAPDGKVRFLLVDALDEALPFGVQSAGGTIVDLLATFVERLPPWLRLVATTRNEPGVIQRMSGLRAYRLDVSDRRNVADIRKFLRQQFHTPNLSQWAAMEGLSVDDCIDEIAPHCGGNFLYARQLCDGLVRGLMNYAELGTRPPGLNSYYLRFFQRQFPDSRSFEEFRPTLEVLVAADQPIAREILDAAAGADGERHVATALRAIGEFVVWDATAVTPGFRLYHKSLSDWLADPARCGDRFWVDAAKGRSRLAQQLLERRATPSLAAEAEPGRILQLLAGAGDWNQFYDLVRTFEFIQPIDSSQWASLYPVLIQNAIPAERYRLQRLPSELVAVGQTLSDVQWKVFMYYRAHSAIVGAMRSDSATAPWLIDFLAEVGWMAKMLAHPIVQHFSERSSYAFHIQSLWDEAIQLLDNAQVAVPLPVREYNRVMQSAF